ncbi:MAG TPA: Hsp20/alpha crystallin family protein [Usitatibacter sp.]|nr:Hsp20/alpha crystallin family protein [Usitatibacter sp.]
MFASLTRFPGDLFPEVEALQRQVEHWLGAGSWPSSIRAAGRGAFPALNMGMTEDAIEIYAFAPGLDPSKIEVQLEKGLLVICGERASELPQESDKTTIYADERFSGSFKRAISLPEDADAARVEASYRDGVLKIVVAKRESAKPRRVEVRAATA